MAVDSIAATNNTANGIEHVTVNGSSSKKPHLVLAAAPHDGHTHPLVRIAALLHERGYEITFIGGEEFEEQIKGTGADHVPIANHLTADVMAHRATITDPIARLQFDLGFVFINETLNRWIVLRDTLEKVKAEDPSREIVVVTETYFMGANALSLGAPLPKCFGTNRPRVVVVQPGPYLASSVDTGPPGFGLIPDASDSGRQRNALLNQLVAMGPFAPLSEIHNRLLKEAGATEPSVMETPLHHCLAIHDVTLQICPPSMEYARSDTLPNVRYAGCLPPKPVPDDFVYPEWWADVTRGDRRVVTVAQGTVAMTYEDLVMPTIQALADRDDLIVVATLGARGATLAPTFAIPSNTRVIDYLVYQAILPHSSVFVMNGGYGGILQGMSNGVPMVLAGETEDKPETTMRAEWAGIAINMRTGTPTVEALRKSIDRVLTEPAFKKRVVEVQKENDALNTIDVVEKAILDQL